MGKKIIKPCFSNRERGFLLFPLMEKEDVDSMPIFFQEGVSWGKLDRVFGVELETIIRQINTAIAA